MSMKLSYLFILIILFSSCNQNHGVQSNLEKLIWVGFYWKGKERLKITQYLEINSGGNVLSMTRDNSDSICLFSKVNLKEIEINTFVNSIPTKDFNPTYKSNAKLENSLYCGPSYYLKYKLKNKNWVGTYFIPPNAPIDLKRLHDLLCRLNESQIGLKADTFDVKKYNKEIITKYGQFVDAPRSSTVQFLPKKK